MAKSIGANLDALRNKRREEEEEEQRKAANVGASLDALRNKRQTEEIPSFKEALYNEKGFLQNQAARSASAEIPDITTPAGKQAVTSMIDRTLPRPGQKVSAVDAPLATPTKTEKNLGTYGLQNFGAGFLSGATSGINAAENVLTDVVTGGERSREMKKIDDYLKTDRGAYDALMSGDPLTEAPTRANIAKKAGVSESAVKSYKTQGTSEYWKTEADEWAEENDLNAVTKWLFGDIAHQIGMQAPGLMLGAALPTSASTSLTETVRNAVSGKTGKAFSDALGKGLIKGLGNAAKGNTTTWLMAANSAGSKFFENQRLYGDDVSVAQNILDSAANGFFESFTEGIGGFSDVPTIGKFFDTRTGSTAGTVFRVVVKNALGMVEEGLEEVLNVPLGGIADKMTVDHDKKWFGDGGVFDWKEMLEAGFQGAFIGGLMGSAATVGTVVDVLHKPDTQKTSSVEAIGMTAASMNPAEISLSVDLLNRESEKFGLEKLDANKTTPEMLETRAAEILDNVILARNEDLLSRKDDLIDRGLATPEGTATHAYALELSEHRDTVTAKELDTLVTIETQRINEIASKVAKETVNEITKADAALPSQKSEAQTTEAEVQETVRSEQMRRQAISDANDGATVVSDLAQRFKNVAPNKTNMKTAQKLADAVRMVQQGQMPDKSYNEVLNLLKSEPVRRTVELELLINASEPVSIDTKNTKTIRASLQTAATAYANLAAQAETDTAVDTIAEAVTSNAIEREAIANTSEVNPITSEANAEAVRSPSDTITTENGSITRAEFVRNFGAELAQQGLAADDVFDNYIRAEREAIANTSEVNTNASEVNAEAATPAEGVSRETISPNANTSDVNPIASEANTTTSPRLHIEYNPKKPLTEIQRTSVEALDRLASAVNVDIYLYDSTETSEYGDSSGRYDVKADRVYIDINAGSHYEGTILRTASHELTHFIKRWSPEEFGNLSRFVEQTLVNNGADISSLVSEKILEAAAHGSTRSKEVAYEEVIADACQIVLTDTGALTELAETNKTLFDKIMDFFRDFIDRVRGVYSDYKPTTEGGRILAQQTQDVLDQLSATYATALVRAGEARTEAQKLLAGEQSKLDDAKTPDGGSLFDYRAIEADLPKYKQMLTEWGGMTDAQVKTLFETLDTTIDIVSKNLEALDYGTDTDLNAERPFKPVKPNSDKLYKISIDFSTLCRKRIVQGIVAEKLQEQLKRPLSKEESIEVRNRLVEIQKEGLQIEVACALCYVEAARLKSPKQLEKFMNSRGAVLHRYYSLQDRATKDKINAVEKQKKADLGYKENEKVKKAADKKIISEAKWAIMDAYQPTEAEQAEIDFIASGAVNVNTFTTADGLSDLAKNHPAAYAAYSAALRSATHSKGLEADVPWRAGDSAEITDNLITAMAQGAGIRSQSWSDFQVMHLLDEIAMTIEMASRGAAMHEYTKVPDAVRLLGLTGRMLNMSLIPTRDGNGFDGVEGMPYETMLTLRNQYPDTAGNICIGVKDDQIRRLLASDEIDYVIPYHKSGNSKATRKLLKIPEWADYEGIQSERGDDEKPAFAEWFDPAKAQETAARENANPSDTEAAKKYGVQYGAYKAMQEAANRYLEICAERNLTPKFKGKVEGRMVDFTTEPNYWKLLIDRKMVNQITGEIIEQKPIQPIFDPEVIYGDTRNGSVGGILGRAIAEYPTLAAHQNTAVEMAVDGFLTDRGLKTESVAEEITEAAEELFEYRNVGYHAGDLGKAEFYHQQGSSRGTGHFGTGTYFVGDEAKIGAGTGYENRPHHAVNFDNYDLYKVRDGEDGRKLHRNLRVIDGGFSPRFLAAAKNNAFKVSDLRSEAWERSDKYDELVYDSDLGFEVSKDYIGANIRAFTEVANENGIPIQSYDEWLSQQGEDVPKSGDSDYDFYKSDYLGYLKETLVKADEDAGNGYDDFRDAYFDLTLRFGTEKVDKALQAVVEHDKVMMPNGEFDYWLASAQRADSRATVFMKALGYEGIDVRGTSLDNVEYGSVIYDLKPEDVLYDYRISGNEATEPHASPRDISTSKAFQDFVKAYDAVHGEGAANTIVRTTEQFDRERARQRKREATAAQMAKIPDTQKHLAAEVKRLESDRRERAKIESLQNPATRKRRLAAQKNRAQMRELLAAAKMNADMRVADQAYRDNYEMQLRLAEATQRAEERLKKVSNELRWSAEARAFTAKEKADARVQAAIDHGKERVKTEVQRTKDRQELRDRQRDMARMLKRRDEQILRDNADVRDAQKAYTRDLRTDPEALRNRNNEDVLQRAAIQEAQHRMDFAARQNAAAQRTGAEVISPTDAVQKAPILEGPPPKPASVEDIMKKGSAYNKTPLREKIAAVPDKVVEGYRGIYRNWVNAAQGIDNISEKQREAGFNVTASDLTTSVRNAKDTAAYILTDALVSRSGEILGKSLSDVILVKDKKGRVSKKGKDQNIYDTYLKLNHTVNRMSVMSNALAQFEEYVSEHEWLRTLFPTDSPAPIDTRSATFVEKLLGRSDEEIAEAHTAANLYNQYAEAENKPVYGTVEYVDVDGKKQVREIHVMSAQEAQDLVDIIESEQPWVKQKAEEYYEWMDTFMREWAVGTSITLEDYETMHRLYPHYVPTYREGKDAGAAASARGGKVSSGQAVKRATGGVSEVRWVQDTLAEQVGRLVTLRRTNDLLLNLVDTGLIDGSDTLGTGIRIRPESLGYGALMNYEEMDKDDNKVITRAISNEGGKYTISAWDNGERITADIDEGLYESLLSLFPQSDKIGKLTRAGRRFSTPQKAFLTGYNPNFFVRNVMRDFGTALIQTEGSMGQYVKHYALAYKYIRTNDVRWQEYQALGNTGSQRYRDDVGLAQFNKIMTPGGFQKALNKIGSFGETTEAAARFAEYLLVAEKEGFTPEAKLHASKAAAEITTDFSRSGDYGRLLNAWVPYTNAATQGVDRVLRDFKNGKGWTRLRRAAIVQALPQALFLLAVVGLGREEEYKGLSDYQKDNYYMFPVPGMKDKWIRFPKTETYGKVLGSGLSRIVEAAWGREDPINTDAFDTLGESFNASWLGNFVEGDVWAGLADMMGIRDLSLFGAGVDLMLNEDFSGREIIGSEFKDFTSDEKAPKSEQYNSDTSAVAYLLARAIGNAISPEEMDYLMSDYFGDFYHGILDLVNVGMLQEFDTKDLVDNLKNFGSEEFVNAWVVDSRYSNRYTSDYYDALDKLGSTIAGERVRISDPDERSTTLAYRTRQAVNYAYGDAISDAYKTARSAVSKAQKDDAREEAVALSIEALDFIERALAGEYGNNPYDYVKYVVYGDGVAKALLALDSFKEEYKFEPDASYAPPSLKVGKNTHDLTDGERDAYKAMYVETYAELAQEAINSKKYRNASDKERAKLLEDVADNARDETTERFRDLLK